MNRICSLLILTLISSKGLAQPFYIPIFGVTHISVKNTSQQELSFWLAPPINELNEIPEVGFSLMPLETKIISLADYQQFSWVQIKSYQKIPIQVFAHIGNQQIQIPEGRSENIGSYLIKEKTEAVLNLTNLTPISQEGIILHSSQSTGGALTVKIPAFGSLQVPLSVMKGERIIIRAQYPITALLTTPTGVYNFHPMKSTQKFVTQTTGTYFQMLSHDRKMSFTFYTDDQQIITEARQQIIDPDKRKILVAAIQLGHGHSNRDLVNILKTPWSWSVAKVFRFSDLAHQTCDGNPQVVEDFLSPWLLSGQAICFWNYKIQREVPEYEIKTGNQLRLSTELAP